MYKKITHTIVEEHFDCPEAVDIAAEVEGSDYYAPMMRRARRPRQNEIITAAQFTNNINTYLNNLNAKWETMATATFDDSANFGAAMEAVFADQIDELGDEMKLYYGPEFGERLNQQLRSIAMNLMYLWRAQKMKLDISNQRKNLLDLLAPAVGILLSTFNNKWDRNVVSDVFTSIIEDYIALGEAKLKRDPTMENDIKAEIAATYSGLATAIANGVVAQQPEFFTA